MTKFDLAKTQVLSELFSVPREARDDAWTQRFWEAVPDASLATAPEQVVRGPDGFPYFALHLPRPATAFESFCVTHVLDPCLDNGFGCVVTVDWEHPEWVFHYGDLWGLKATGAFSAAHVVPPDTSKPRQVMTGAPSDSLLPPYARKAIRSWLVAQGVADPRVMLLAEPDAVPSESLVFSVYPDQFPDRDQYGALMGRLRWFVRPQLGLVGAERADWCQGFEAL